MRGKILVTGRGRPERTPVDGFRARAWFNAVAEASCPLSIYGLEKRFAPDYQTKITGSAHQHKKGGEGVKKHVRSGMWHKYKRGDATPSKAPTPGCDESIVKRVEDRYKGTERWLNLPLWDMLDRRPVTMDEIKKAYSSLAKEVRNLFIACNPKDKLSFWRLPVKTQDVLQALRKLRGLDAATAVMTMIREAEVTQNQEQHIACFKAWFEVAPSMADDGVSLDLIEDIVEYTRDWFRDIVYSDAGSKGVKGADVIEYISGAQPPYLDWLRDRQKALGRRK